MMPEPTGDGFEYYDYESCCLASCNKIDDDCHLQDLLDVEFSFNEAERAGRVEGVIQGEMR